MSTLYQYMLYPILSLVLGYLNWSLILRDLKFSFPAYPECKEDERESGRGRILKMHFHVKKVDPIYWTSSQSKNASKGLPSVQFSHWIDKHYTIWSNLHDFLSVLSTITTTTLFSRFIQSFYIHSFIFGRIYS